MSVGITKVGTKETVVEKSGKGHEETLDRLGDTRTVGVGEGVKKGSTAFTTIDTLTGTAGSTALDMMLPVGAKENILNAFRKVLRRAVHLESFISIKLAKFGIIPFLPIGKRLELAAGEMTEGLFFGSSLGGANGVDSKFQGRRWDGG